MDPETQEGYTSTAVFRLNVSARDLPALLAWIECYLLHWNGAGNV